MAPVLLLNRILVNINQNKKYKLKSTNTIFRFSFISGIHIITPSIFIKIRRLGIGNPY